MDRLIQTFGERYIKERLGRLQEIYGIEVGEVNSAYSRRECSSCGYVDRGKTERGCKRCGDKVNAQESSAKDLFGRISLGEFHQNLRKREVLKMLIIRHLERLKGCRSAPFG
jgi:putative transposase